MEIFNMSYILTLVASTKTAPVTEKHFKDIAHIIDAYNLKFTSKIIWLDKDIAAEVAISDSA